MHTNAEERGLSGPALFLHYARVYALFVRAGFLALLAYPLEFALRNLANLAYNLAMVGAIWVMFSFVPDIRGYTRHEVLFMYALGMLARATWHLLWVDMMSIGQYVQRGDIDRLLARPLDPLFQVVAGYLDDDDWGELVVGVVLLVTAGRALGVTARPWLWVWTVLAIACGSIIYAAIHLTAAATAFWVVRSQAFSGLAWDIDRFSRYPLDIYPPGLRLVLTWVVPFGFAAYYPAQLLLPGGHHLLLAALTPVVAVLALSGAYRFWRLGLAKYQGTGH